jgi:hypothetical protein
MGSCVLAAWQAHREYRAFARLTRYGHIATHHAREFAGEGKAEPRPPIAARGQGIGLGEFLEQFRLLFGGQADTGIRDGKLNPVVSVRHLAHPQRDLARVNLQALLNKLSGICRSRIGST